MHGNFALHIYIYNMGKQGGAHKWLMEEWKFGNDSEHKKQFPVFIDFKTMFYKIASLL